MQGREQRVPPGVYAIIRDATPTSSCDGVCATKPLWVHGHTHDSFDYMLHGTRVACNPRGYAKNGVNENPLFGSNSVVQIGPSAQGAEQE
ncbi:hypothetical protein D9M69_636870 [compost metagenome]